VKEMNAEQVDENQDLSADRDDDSDSGTCQPGGGTDFLRRLRPGCFKGTFQGQDTHDILPPGATTVAIRTTATGTGTHLGRFLLIRGVTGKPRGLH
jgi:hypothetical protein